MKDKIYIAKIGKAVGLKGELKLHIDYDFPEQFKKDAQFTLSNKQIVTIEHYNINRSVVKFVGFDDINIAKKLINKEVFTTAKNTRELCDLNENQFFWFDIIGLDIVEDDKLLGKIVDIHRYTNLDYLEVTTSNEMVQNSLPKTFMIPYNDTYIMSVDTNEKKVVTSKAFEILENS